MSKLRRPTFGDGGTVLKEKEYRKELASYNDSRLEPLRMKGYSAVPEREKFMPTAGAPVPDPLTQKDKTTTKPGSFGMAFSQARTKAKEDAIAKGLTDPAEITKFVANQVFDYNGKSYLTAIKEEVAHLPKKVQEYVATKKADGDLKKVEQAVVQQEIERPVTNFKFQSEDESPSGFATYGSSYTGSPSQEQILYRVSKKENVPGFMYDKESPYKPKELEVSETKIGQDGQPNWQPIEGTSLKLDSNKVKKVASTNLGDVYEANDSSGKKKYFTRRENGSWYERLDFKPGQDKIKATPRQVQIPAKENPESWLASNGFQKAFARKVTDGDTYESGTTSKRLANLSSPESSQPNYTEASDNLNRILASGGQLYEKKTGKSFERDLVESVILKDGKIMALDSLGALTNPGLSALSSDNQGNPLYHNAGISYGPNESRMQRNARLLKQGAKAKGTKSKNQFGH